MPHVVAVNTAQPYFKVVSMGATIEFTNDRLAAHNCLSKATGAFKQLWLISKGQARLIREVWNGKELYASQP